MRITALFIFLLVHSFSILGYGAEPLRESEADSRNDYGNKLGSGRPTKLYYSLNPLVVRHAYLLGRMDLSGLEGVVIETFEGQVKLGLTSSLGGVLDRSCYEDMRRELRIDEYQDETRRELLDKRATVACSTPVNPWFVSGWSSEWRELFNDLGQDPVLVRYKDYLIYPFTETNSIIQEVYRIDPTLDISQSFSADFKDFSGLKGVILNWIVIPIRDFLAFEEKYYDGRIVRAGLDGKIRPEHEVVMQVGDSGNNFVTMTVGNEELFEYIVQAMATGRKLRVHYRRFFGFYVYVFVNLFTGGDTAYRVYAVEIRPEEEIPEEPNAAP